MEPERKMAVELPDADHDKAEQFLKGELNDDTPIEGSVLKYILEGRNVEDMGEIDVVCGSSPNDIIFFKTSDGNIDYQIYYPGHSFTKEEVLNVVAVGHSIDARIQKLPETSARKLEDVISDLQKIYS